MPRLKKVEDLPDVQNYTGPGDNRRGNRSFFQLFLLSLVACGQIQPVSEGYGRCNHL